MGTAEIERSKRVVVFGGTGFVARALLPELVAAGHSVRATSRDASRAPTLAGVEWLDCNVQLRSDVERALQGAKVAYFLVHEMGSNAKDYAQAEQRSAFEFRQAAARAGLERVIYLGGVAPAGKPSEHLESRLNVGKILREGSVPALELRASMIIGNGSVSWCIVRDLALRLPAMLLPAWTESRTCPIAIDDVTAALLRGLDIALPKSAWYDIAGPETLSAREILLRVAALRGRRLPSVRVPLLSVSLSSWWLKLVTRADFGVARELVLGLSTDLLPADRRYWDEIDYQPRFDFDAAARRALEDEDTPRGPLGLGGRLEEAVVQLTSSKLPRV